MEQWECMKFPHNRMGKESRAGKLQYLKGKEGNPPLPARLHPSHASYINKSTSCLSKKKNKRYRRRHIIFIAS